MTALELFYWYGIIAIISNVYFFFEKNQKQVNLKSAVVKVK